MSLLQNHQLSTFGHGDNISKESITYIESPRGRVAFIALNASEVAPDAAALKKVVEVAAGQSELQIIFIHWGIEYDIVHSPGQEVMAKQLVAAGADLIVGHHPHVVQDIDVIDGVVVFYSLGNYIFDQYFSTDTMEGLVVTLELTSDPILSLIPVTSQNSLSQPTLMAPAIHQSFLEKLADRSDASLKSDIKKGIVPLRQMVATSTKMAMIGR